MLVASGIKFWYTQRTNSFHAHDCHPTALNIYLMHTKIRKPYWCITSCRHHCWSTNTGKNGFRWWQICWSADFQFGSSQESKIELPLVIDSVWDCPGITLHTIKDEVRPSRAGVAVIALFLAIVVVLDSSSTIMHPRLCPTLQRGRTLWSVPACGTFLQMLSICLNRIKIFQGK